MKQFGRQLHNQAKSVKLRAVERAELKDRLQMYMEYHPLPVPKKEISTAALRSATAQPNFASAVQKWFTPFAGVTAAFLILILPVIAEQAVPGDLLYPMKVQINEEVRSTLTFSSQDKIAWETTRIERRLAEARLLESQGRLTDEIEQSVAAAVREYAKNTEVQIAALREIDADEAAVAQVSFASSLAVQSEVLSQAVSERATSASASPVLLAVQSEEQQANARSAESAPSYKRMLALIETETTTAAELFSSIKGSIPEDEVERIERRFSDVQTKIDNTIAAHAVTEEDEEDAGMTTTLALPTDTDAPVSAEATTAEVASTGESESEMATAMSLATDTASTGLATEIAPEPPVPSSVAEDTSESAEKTKTRKDAAAVTELRDILQDVKRLIRFMSDITVRESVSIDEWVPIALSSEERITDLEAFLSEMKQIQEVVDNHQLSIETTAEVEAKQQSLVRNIFTIEQFLTTDDIESAEQEVQVAYKDAKALQALLRDQVASTTSNQATTTASSSRGATATTAVDSLE